MKKNLALCVAVALCTPVCSAFAAEITEPTEVGTTTMPPGQYTLVEKNTAKSYSLMVTRKGTMIMAPGGSKALTETSAPATTTATTAPAATQSAQQTAAGAAVPATSAAAKPGNAALKGLMQKGMNEGMNQLMKSGTTKKLEQLIK
ncbi:MAG: hypothetical protein K2W95_26920 [Candidatus Obscuribacterales bacterium]|nr:hypothetical protein [Candidatus Obscuribacterales bacterium]